MQLHLPLLLRLCRVFEDSPPPAERTVSQTSPVTGRKEAHIPKKNQKKNFVLSGRPTKTTQRSLFPRSRCELKRQKHPLSKNTRLLLLLLRGATGGTTETSVELKVVPHKQSRRVCFVCGGCIWVNIRDALHMRTVVTPLSCVCLLPCFSSLSLSGTLPSSLPSAVPQTHSLCTSRKKTPPPPPQKKKTLAHTCTQHLCLCLHICLLPSLTTSCYYRCLHSVTLNIRNMQQESKFSTSMHSAGCTVVSVMRVRLSTQCCRTINRSLLEISSVPSSVTLCREP